MEQYDIPFLSLSNSSKEKRYHRCTRLFEFNKLYGHAREDYEEGLAAGAGHALHGAYQTYLATGDKEAALWRLMQRYPVALQKGENDPRSIFACYAAFEQMIANPLDSRYKLAFVNVDGVEKPAVEVPCRMIFKDISVLKTRHVPVYWDMFIDAILWDTLQQRFVVMDIKTTRKVRYDYSTTFKRDPQCLPYAYIIDQVLGQPATSLGVIYLVVYIDAIQPKALKYEFMKTSRDIEEWAFDTAVMIRDIKWMAETGFFPKRGEQCDNFKECIYNSCCDYTSPESIKEYLRLKFGEMDYEKKEKEFNPWFQLELTVEGL